MQTKKPFNFRSQDSDGPVLCIHHTIQESCDQFRRLRFISATFNHPGELLACSDHRGNVFVFDLSTCFHWRLHRCEPGRTLSFSPTQTNILLIAKGAPQFDILIVNALNENVISVLSGHTVQAEHASFSNESNLVLTHRFNEAIIWELLNYTKFFVLNLNSGPRVRCVQFAPISANIAACFDDNTLQIWSKNTMEPLKRFTSKSLGNVTCFTFTTNGKILAAAGLSSNMFLIDVDTWSIQSLNISKDKVSGVKQICFSSYKCYGGANRILSIVSSDCSIHFYDILNKQLVCTLLPDDSNFKTLALGSNGKFIACILQLGQINVYNISQILDRCKIEHSNTFKNEAKNSVPVQMSTSSEMIVDNRYDNIIDQMKVSLNKTRLEKILSQFNEYPSKYRKTIWGALLDVPCNRNAFVNLINRPMHPLCANIEDEYKLPSSIYVKHLKRLLSCLFYWCPSLIKCNFLVEFVFPFVNAFYNDPLYCFEIVATILVNQCQAWFEFSPLMPISVFAIVENTLGNYDRKLLSHFFKYKITSEVYAWQILKTGFSEVLTSSEWFTMWDHVMTSDAAFLLMAVIAYNMMNRNALLNFSKINQFQAFYIKQNPIDIMALIKKSYSMLEISTGTIQAKQYLKKFIPLTRGECYPQYPLNSIYLN
ncbi:TBC1 domain family member 31 [Arctopsyche grandis]|uniref:TBC1 domain family member 31 n=1 Tax=Arctopsyche grandis TaxID=121162 RepID=UPI00406D9FD4